MFRFQNLLISFSVFLLFATSSLRFANGTLDFCIPSNREESQPDSDEVPKLIGQFKANLEEFIDESTKPTAPIDSFHLNFSHPAITLTGTFYNFTIDLVNYDLKILQLKPSVIELFNLTFPSIKIQGSNYDFDGYVGKEGGLFRVYGSNGSFMVNPLKVSVALKVGLEANSSGLCVPVHIALNMQDMKTVFEHNMGGDSFLEPLFNKLIGYIGAEATGIFWDEYTDSVAAPIQKIINKFLHWNSTKNNALIKLTNWIHAHKVDILERKVPI